MIYSHHSEVWKIYHIKLLIRDIRLEKGLSQEQLARLANTSQSHISALELGTKSCSLKVFEQICNALNVHPYDLLEIDKI